MEKTEVNMNKPIYAGFTFLDLSKMCFYEFDYDCMKERLGDKCQQTYSIFVFVSSFLNMPILAFYSNLLQYILYLNNYIFLQ